MNYLFYLFLSLAFAPYCLQAQTKYVETRTILGEEIQVFRLPKTEKKFQSFKYFSLMLLQDDLQKIEEATSQNKQESWRYIELNKNQKFEEDIRALKKKYGKKYPFELWEAEWKLYQKYFNKIEKANLEKRQAEDLAEAKHLAYQARLYSARILYDTLDKYGLEVINEALENRYLKDSTELITYLNNTKKADITLRENRKEQSRRYKESEAKIAEERKKKAEIAKLTDNELNEISTSKRTNSSISATDALKEMRERDAARRRRSSSSSSSTRRRH